MGTQGPIPNRHRGQIRFAYIEDAEPPDRYCPGGYHPLYVGDVLHDRYHIVHKLGFGSYSTTWLAKDTSQSDRYVAIKVMTADSSAASKEVKILRQLAARASFDKEGNDTLQSVDNGNVPSIWNGFTISGPNDLHLGNVLFKLPESSKILPPDKLYEEIGSPVLEPVEMLGNEAGQPLPAGVPTHIVVPAWFGVKSEEVRLREASVLVTDFGESFMPYSEQRYHSNTPRTVRPPETRFLPGEPLSYSADIWTLACSIWTILGQRSLFEIFSPTDDYVTREQVDALGRPPPRWWERWAARCEYFTDRGDLLDPTSKRMTLEDRFEHSIQAPRRDVGMETVGEQERVALLDMLRGMLAFIPEERPTAARLMTCDWMTKWALPNLREVERVES
ncbi:hypothetical protein Daus18300_000360 [Diaporthe australafricana]|uniref:non-specific serine/threonine protein kinase n=1 Tax=Diaporthe australafricana TaxID=127596 RepID=A0ABR3Y671_9PEZI